MVKAAAIKYPNGNVYTGKRHCDCFHAAFLAREKNDGGRVIQGFVTEHGLFLTRSEAAAVAIGRGQIDHLSYSKTELFSEDLY